MIISHLHYQPFRPKNEQKTLPLMTDGYCCRLKSGLSDQKVTLISGRNIIPISPFSIPFVQLFIPIYTYLYLNKKHIISAHRAFHPHRLVFSPRCRANPKIIPPAPDVKLAENSATMRLAAHPVLFSLLLTLFLRTVSYLCTPFN